MHSSVRTYIHASKVITCTHECIPGGLQSLLAVTSSDSCPGVWYLQNNVATASTSSDLMRWACRWVFRIGMPAKVRIALVEAMADLEHRLAFGTSERLQLGSLVAAFSAARDALVDSAK